MASGAPFLSSPFAAPLSLWSDTTSRDTRYPQLTHDLDVDVAVVGGGYTGLSAAHTLRQCGTSVAVLEARQPGWGASGRNGGVISSKFRLAWSDMARKHGVDTTQQLHTMALQAVDHVESLVEAYQLGQADFRRAGSLLCAHNERANRRIQAEAQWQQKVLEDPHIALLDANEVEKETGSSAFSGGVLFRNQATIHPLNYVRGLAAGLDKRYPGIIFQDTPVVAIHKEANGIVLRAEAGQRIRARHVIVATNAYSNLTAATKSLQRSLIPFRSSIIATERLPAPTAQSLLVNERSYSETRRMMRWFRKVDGRILFGGRGAFGDEHSHASFSRLQRAMVDLFPSLQGVKIKYQWAGYVGMTMDKLPRVGRVTDWMTIAAGYNGAGVALASLLGCYAAQSALGQDPEVSILDAASLKPIPFYQLQGLGVRAVVGWYELLDALGL